MSLEVATGKAAAANTLLEAFQRGRYDHQYFSREFLHRTLHDGQLEFVENANATVNALATANRYGKTTLLSHLHNHACIFKTGGEPRYMVDDEFDFAKFLQLRYQTVHTAFGWETAALVWDEQHKLLKECPKLAFFVPPHGAPRSLPPHIEYINGSKWKFRTLGHDASGVDGNSFYLVSIDEAGWVPGLELMMANVIRVRVADVRGRIVVCGTFKPGVSKDFYKICVRASAYTGVAIGFDHRDDSDDNQQSGGLDSSIRKYCKEFGIDLDEYADAMKGQY